LLGVCFIYAFNSAFKNAMVGNPDNQSKNRKS
jgi:hypothetical protein